MIKNAVKSVGRAAIRARGSFPATIRGQKFECDPYHIAFWRAASQNRWETSTFDVLEKFLTPSSTYVDIGAWIGPTALYASRLCKEVYCFEPDPIALHYLNWNISLNAAQNVTAMGLAIAAQSGVFRMASFGDTAGDSMTSLLNTEAQSGVNVLALSWQEFCEKSALTPPDLIKIDVEGAEFDLLPTMTDYLKQHKPALFLSTHAPYLPEGSGPAGMQAISEVLSFYPKIYDEFLNKISPQDMCSNEAAEGFQTYLFTF